MVWPKLPKTKEPFSEVLRNKLDIRDGVYYMLSITITITLQSITITFQIFKSITITITLASITFYI